MRTDIIRMISTPVSTQARVGERGTTLIEFALCGILFLVIVIFTVECAILCFRMVSVQYVASRTCREGLLANVNTLQIRQAAVNFARPLGIHLHLVNDIQVCNDNELDNTDATCDCRFYNPPRPNNPRADECTTGGRDDFVAVRIDITAPFFLGLYDVPLIGAAMGKREMPMPPG